MTDILGINAVLGIDSGLGVPERMLKNRGVPDAGSFGQDIRYWTEGGPPGHGVDASAWLVPSELREFVNLFPTTGDLLDGMTFLFSVEPQEQRIDRAHTRNLANPYSVPANKVTSIVYGSVLTQTNVKTSYGVFDAAGISLARKSNSRHAIGISSGAVAHREGVVQADCLGPFVMMWLMQLDVAAGANLLLNIDHSDLRSGVPALTPPSQEAATQTSTEGIRLHVDSLDALTTALLYCATHRASVIGLSAWVSRYEWPTVKMTLYGGNLHSSTQPQRVKGVPDATRMAASIVSMAGQYGLQEQCAAAHATALILFGDRCPNSKLRLRCQLPNLYHDVHDPLVSNLLPQMCYALGNIQLPYFSAFLGHANAELLRDISRATCEDGLRVRDHKSLREYLAKVDVHMAASIVDRYSASQTLVSKNIIDWEYYVPRAMRIAWNHTGLLHNIVLGRVVAKSITEDAVRPITVPHPRMLEATDLVHDAKEYAQAAKSAYLFNELLSNGGQTLYASLSTSMPKHGRRSPLQADYGNYIGRTVQFKALGFKNPVTVIYHNTNNVLFGPSPTVVHATTPEDMKSVPITVRAETVQILDERAREDITNMDDIMRMIHRQQGPRASTSFRHMPSTRITTTLKTKPDVRANDQARQQQKELHTPAPLELIEAANSLAVDAVNDMLDKELVPGPTDGTGLLCGANALTMSLITQGGDQSVTPELIQEIIRKNMTQEETQAINAALKADPSGELGQNNYTASQLAVAARARGFDLVVVDRVGSAQRRAWPASDTKAQKGAVVLFNETGSHWEGLVKSTGRAKFRVATNAGTPAVTAHIKQK